MIFQECARVGFCPEAKFGNGSDDPARRDLARVAAVASTPNRGIKWLIKGATGLVKATLGMDAAPESVQQVRRQTCRVCPQAITEDDQLKKCNACGCHLLPKTSLAHEHCPMHRWPIAGKVAIAQPGRAGDLLTLIPAFRWLAERGQHVTLFVDDAYRTVCERFSWLTQINLPYGNPDPLVQQIKSGRFGDFDEIRVTTVGWDRPTGKDFLTAQWERTGCPVDLIDTLPLDLSEVRDRNAEREVVMEHLLPGDFPVVLFNVTHFRPDGRAAGFDAGPELLAYLREWFPRVRFLDLGRIRAPRIIDLLGLYERASLLINSDCGTLHLGYATRTPTIGIVLDDPLRASPRRPHWVERLTYSEAAADFDRIATAAATQLLWSPLR